MKVENDLLHKACIKQLSLNEYRQLFVFLSNTPSNHIADTLTSDEIIKILTFLNFYEDDMHEISRDIAKYLLILFPINFDSSLSDSLLPVVTTENYVLSKLIFDEINNRIINNNEQSEPIRLVEEFTKLITNYIFEENPDLSRSSQKLLVNYCKQSRETCKETFLQVIKTKFLQISSNSVNFFRYLDVSLEIALNTSDKELFEMVINEEIIGKMSELVYSDDLLAHLNVLESIRMLVGHQLGYQLLTLSGILKNLYMRLQEIDQGPWKALLLPGYLSVFMELCQDHCMDALMSYKEFINVLNDNFDCSDLTLKLRVLEIVANIASVPECKIFIHTEYNYLIPKALVVLVNLFNGFTTEPRVRSGVVLATIFSVPTRHKHFQTLSDINEGWFAGINGNNNQMISSILSLIKLPIEDLKLTGLKLAAAISNQNWGIGLIGNHTELVDYLMVRADQWKNCIDMKFQIITNLVDGMNNNPDSILCNENNARKIRQYFNEGKYFMPIHAAEMMVDEDV